MPFNPPKIREDEGAKLPLLNNLRGVDSRNYLARERAVRELKLRAAPLDHAPLVCQYPHGEVAEGDDDARLDELDFREEFRVAFDDFAGDPLALEKLMGRGDILLLPGDETAVSRRLSLRYERRVTLRAHDTRLLEETTQLLPGEAAEGLAQAFLLYSRLLPY